MLPLLPCPLQNSRVRYVYLTVIFFSGQVHGRVVDTRYTLLLLLSYVGQ